jgi:hypothetical protein
MAGADADAKLIPKSQLTSVLVQSKCIAFSGSSLCLLLDLEVSTIDTHQEVIVDAVILLTFKVNQ